jgi:hypothetical protein
MLAILSKNKKAKSLTLKEVLVAVGITLLLIGVSIPLLNRDRGRLSLEKEAEAIAAYYTKAQNYSFHPERKEVDSYSVVPESCDASNSCKRLVIVANYKDEEGEEIDSFNIPRAVIKTSAGEIPIVKYQLGTGSTDEDSEISIQAYFESNEAEKALIKIYPTGAVDVQI